MSQALFGPKEEVHVHGDTSSDVQLYPSVKCRTLLVTDVGMTGLNLQQADTLFFLDLPWKKFFLDQSMARSCRYGQTRTVTAHLLVAKNTLDTYTTTMYAHRSHSSMSVAEQVVASLDGEKELGEGRSGLESTSESAGDAVDPPTETQSLAESSTSGPLPSTSSLRYGCRFQSSDGTTRHSPHAPDQWFPVRIG
jgi:hypothetical protein